ncbi:MAG: response regulator transcription factor [Anaerolineae bacterium]|nr:response regulator transcription factor [Anaerolineae bacterium]MEB2286874.1 response regulator transcription factor [Anaerolineae bacterium]
MDRYDQWCIAIVDDDEILSELISEGLEAEGYQTITFARAATFLQYVRQHGLPHLALIDLGLPDVDGFMLSSQLKTLGDVPIIFVSGHKETETVVKGLQQYAEDYVRKPFDMRELAARIYRVLSRIPSLPEMQSRITRIDDWLAVDFGQSALYAGKRTFSLTPIEANILHILLRSAEQTVPARVLLSRVWPGQNVYEDTLRVHMHRLRRKVEPNPRRPQYILTARGVGYCFALPGRAQGADPTPSQVPSEESPTKPAG